MTATQGRKFWPVLRAAGPTLLALVLMAWAGQWYAKRWKAVELSVQSHDIAWGWLLLALALLAAHAVTALAIWRLVLRVSGVRLTWHESVDVFAPTLLARYIPGRIWANAARLALTQRIGVPVRRAGGAMVWEAGVALGTACIIAAVTVGEAVDPQLKTAILTAAAVATVAFGTTMAARRMPSGLMAALGFAFLGWLLFGLAHLAIARSVVELGFTDLSLMTGAMAVAWSAGYLAIVVPLGLGVRDGILLVLLTPLLDPPSALLFVALARLVQLAADGLLTALWVLLRRRLWAAIPSA